TPCHVRRFRGVRSSCTTLATRSSAATVPRTRRQPLSTGMPNGRSLTIAPLEVARRLSSVTRRSDIHGSFRCVDAHGRLLIIALSPSGLPGELGGRARHFSTVAEGWHRHPPRRGAPAALHHHQGEPGLVSG